MNSRYELIVYRSQDDDCFVVEVPELPGCMADGASYQQAVANAEPCRFELRPWRFWFR